jgi:streptogramin lyase
VPTRLGHARDDHRPLGLWGERLGPTPAEASRSPTVSSQAPSGDVRASGSPPPLAPDCPPVQAAARGIRTLLAIDLDGLVPWELAAGDDGRLYVLSRDYSTFRAAAVTAYDLAPGGAREVIDLGTDGWDMAVSAEGVWVTANNPAGRVLHVDPVSGEVDDELESDPPLGMTLVAGFGSIWTADDGFDIGQPSYVTQIDPDSRSVVRRVEVGLSPQSIGTGDGYAWTGNHGDYSVSKVDPRGGGSTTTSVFIGSVPHEVFGGATALWIAASHDRRVVRLDYRSTEITNICLPFNPFAMARAADGSIWVASSRFDEAQSDELAILDEATGSLRSVEDLGAKPIGIVALGGSMWLLTKAPNRLLEVAIDG